MVFWEQTVVDEEDEIPAVEQSTVEQQIEQLQADLAAANDKMLRARADLDNMRRRSALDVEGAHKYSVEKIARELLHVVDTLEKGIASAKEGGDSKQKQIDTMLHGMELTHKLLLTTLEKFQIHQIDPIGQPFDPKLHEALTTQETVEMAPNFILTVVQKGFVIHDRVLRPARVIVAKAPS